MASNLKRIADAVSDAPDCDARRVRSAREALARGEYEVDAKRIAEKLLQIDSVARDSARFRRG